MVNDAVSQWNDRSWVEVVEQLREKNKEESLSSEWIARQAIVSAVPDYSEQQSAISINRHSGILDTGKRLSIDWVISECPYYDQKPQDVPELVRRQVAVNLLTHAIEGYGKP